MKLNFKSTVESDATHPVVMLIGSVQEGLKMTEDLDGEVKLIYINKDTLDELDTFCAQYGNKLKIAVCVLVNVTDLIVGSLLKRLEDVPDFVKIVIVGNWIPRILLNRGLVINVAKPNAAAPEIIDLLRKNPRKTLEIEINDDVLFDSICKFIDEKFLNAISNNMIFEAKVMRDVWEKMLEINDWLLNSLIKTREAAEMLISIIEAASVA
jgi:phosphopantetheine adenylyltransferase